MQKFLIGYEISGHLLVEANNSGAASATALAIVAAAARSLEAHGENEYECPSGALINVTTKTPIRANLR